MNNYTKESFKTKLFRLGFNTFPAYRRTGGKVTHISADWKLIKVSLKLRFATRNYVGSIFGGSIYGSLDPMYMIQLIKILGNNYVVWDKSAEIKFKRPIKTKVFANFIIDETLVESIKIQVAKNKEIDIEIPISFKDKKGIVYAEVLKKMYIADKQFYKNKLKKKNKN